MGLFTEQPHLRAPNPTLGAETGFFEGFDASYQAQKRSWSMLGLEADFGDAMQANSDLVYKLTGERMMNHVPGGATEMDVMSQSVEFARAQQEGAALSPFDERKARSFPKRAEARQEFIRQNQRLHELKKLHPEIRTMEDIWNGVQVAAQEAEQRNSDVQARGGFRAAVGGFAGGMAGSFTLRDPANVATLPLGWGKTAAVRIMSDVGINAGVESVNQFTGVQERRELLGVEHSTKQALTNVAFAGAGAGVIRGGIEGAPAGLRVAKDRVVPMMKATPRQLKMALNKLPFRKDEAFIAGNMVDRDADILRQNPKGVGVDDAGHIAKTQEAYDKLNEPMFASPDEAVPLPTGKDLEYHLSAHGDINTEIEGYVADIIDMMKEIDDFDVSIPAKVSRALGHAVRSLSQFIREAGGIFDESGELQARGISSQSLVGLVRKTAKQMQEAGNVDGALARDNVSRNIDRVKEEAFDAGYFPTKNSYDEITNDEFLDAIAQDVSGDRVYTGDDWDALQSSLALNEQARVFDQLGFDAKTTLEDGVKMLREALDPISEAEPISLEDFIRNLPEDGAPGYSLDEIVRGMDEMETAMADTLDADIEAQAAMAKDGDIGLGENVDLEMSVPFERETAEGNTYTEFVKLKDLIDDWADDDALVEAMKVCAL